MSTTLNGKDGLKWVPTLAIIGAIPFVLVQQLSSVLYKNLGISNTDITFYTSMLYLPWVLKPLWSPLVDIFKTKRFWLVSLQVSIGASLAALALVVSTPYFFILSLGVLWVIAFASASHDIAADGYYMLALSASEQAAYIGVRSLFFRLANIVAGGVPVILVGYVVERVHGFALAWTIALLVLAVLFVSLAFYHLRVLPFPPDDQGSLKLRTEIRLNDVYREFVETFASFFRKPEIGVLIAFFLLFRLGEAQALKVVSLFMLDTRAQGGLGLSNQEFGLVYSFIGIGSLTVGGLLGGWSLSRFGLKRLLWGMVLTMHLPNLAFVFLAFQQPESLSIIALAIAIEQFGYGFGFTAFLMIMMMISDGPRKTSHYAICTGFMAAGMMLPGLFSGALVHHFGYPSFFMWVCICTVPGLILTRLIRIHPHYGRKDDVCK